MAKKTPTKKLSQKEQLAKALLEVTDWRRRHNTLHVDLNAKCQALGDTSSAIYRANDLLYGGTVLQLRTNGKRFRIWVRQFRADWYNYGKKEAGDNGNFHCSSDKDHLQTWVQLRRLNPAPKHSRWLKEGTGGRFTIGVQCNPQPVQENLEFRTAWGARLWARRNFGELAQWEDCKRGKDEVIPDWRDVSEVPAKPKRTVSLWDVLTGVMITVAALGIISLFVAFHVARFN